MRKRYAANYILLHERGYVKQYVVEIEEGRVHRLFPLTEEIHSVSWLSGAIVLWPKEVTLSAVTLREIDFQAFPTHLENPTQQLAANLQQEKYIAAWVDPYDFATMHPTETSIFRQLD